MVNKDLNVCYATDDNYAMQAGISIFSLLHHNKSFKKVNIYILDDSISNDNKKKIKNIVNFYKQKVFFLSVKEAIKMIKKLSAKEWVNNSFSTYSRIFIADVLPSTIEKIIYFDCDTIINDDLMSMWKFDLEENILGMVKEAGHNDIKKIIGIDTSNNYFNAGVLLINLKNWKQYKLQKHILAKMRKCSYYPYVDQDLINICASGKVKVLPPKYNLTPPYMLWNDKQLKQIYNNKNGFYPDNIISNAKLKPVIIHYAGEFFGRPWEANNVHPFSNLYDKYLYSSISPWNDYAKTFKNHSFVTLLQRKLYKILPKKIYQSTAMIAATINIKILKYQYRNI